MKERYVRSGRTWIDRQIDGCMDGWMKERFVRRTWIDRWIDGLMDGWMDGLKDVWIKR